jgi:hypothetical protein
MRVWDSILAVDGCITLVRPSAFAANGKPALSRQCVCRLDLRPAGVDDWLPPGYVSRVSHPTPRKPMGLEVM